MNRVCFRNCESEKVLGLSTSPKSDSPVSTPGWLPSIGNPDAGRRARAEVPHNVLPGLTQGPERSSGSVLDWEGSQARSRLPKDSRGLCSGEVWEGKHSSSALPDSLQFHFFLHTQELLNVPCYLNNYSMIQFWRTTYF